MSRPSLNLSAISDTIFLDHWNTWFDDERIPLSPSRMKDAGTALGDDKRRCPSFELTSFCNCQQQGVWRLRLFGVTCVIHISSPYMPLPDSTAM